MDEEVRRAVRAVVRCGREAIERTIEELKAELKKSSLGPELCSQFWTHSINHFKDPKYFDTARIEGDFLCCNECGVAIGSSVVHCVCAPFPIRGLYMIGDRDNMRIRCRRCHGIFVEDPPEGPVED